MLEQFDHIETKNLGWLLLRSFVASPHLANSARCLGLKGIHFNRVGFDWWVDDLLKGLFVEGRRNIARLRQELPDLFDVLDRGGPIITSDDTVRALTKWFIDEAHYLDDARDLGLCDCIDIADRNRRRDVEACLRYDLEDFAKLLLPDGWRRDGLGVSRSATHRDWDAQHKTLGWVSVRITGGKHKGEWHASNVAGKYASGWSPVLFVQLVRSLSLREALDWSEDYLERPDEQPTKSLPEVITRILSRASDQPPHTVTASKPAGAVDVIERPAERPALAAPPPPAPSSLAPAKIAVQALLPLDRAAPADIEARNLQAAPTSPAPAAVIIEEEVPPRAPAVPERRETEAVRQVMPASLSPATTAAAKQPKRSKTTIPLDAATQAMLLQIQDSELRFLMRLYQAGQQERGEAFIGQADMLRQYGVNRDVLYETDELGRLIGFTPEKDEFVGHNALDRPTITYKRKGRFVEIPAAQFLRRITPGSETPDETQARRAKSKRPHRSERERQRTARSRAETKERRRRVDDLNCRASAIRDVLIPGKWTTVKRVAPDLEKIPAFEGLTGKSLHRAIERELAKEPLSNTIQEKKTAAARRGFSIRSFRLK